MNHAIVHVAGDQISLQFLKFLDSEEDADHPMSWEEKGEDALERLLARQEETAMLVRGLVQQVDFCPSFFNYRKSICICVSAIEHRWRSCGSKEENSRGRKWGESRKCPFEAIKAASKYQINFTPNMTASIFFRLSIATI